MPHSHPNQHRRPPASASQARKERELKVVSIERLEDEARKILSPGRFAIMGPCGDGWTYRENRRAFADYPILPRRLQKVDDKDIDLSTTLLGHKLPIPVFTCPTGGQGNFHVKAELPNAAGTGMAGSLFVASGASNRPMEEIAKATTGPKWFQIYMNRDMELNRWLVQRAKAAGYSAIVLTADALGPGQSDDYIALGRPRDPALTAGNHDPAYGGHGNFSNQKRDLSFTDITFLREASGLPVLVKGVVQPDDIRESLAHGAAGIWVSNHGGRQMDGGPASISLMRGAVDAVGGRVPVNHGQWHPARHRYLQGVVARCDGRRHRPSGAVGPDRRRLARRQERLRATGFRVEVHDADVGRGQGQRAQSRQPCEDLAPQHRRDCQTPRAGDFARGVGRAITRP